MAQDILFNGTVYTIPDTGELDWGLNLTNYFVAIPQGALQKTGGSFILTADANFGSNFGLVALYLKSITANISTAGVIRLARTDSIGWRNVANGANLLLTVDGSNNLTFNGTVIPLSGLIVNADISASAAIVRSKLASGTASHVLINDGSGVMSSEVTLAKVRGGSGQDNSSLTFPSTGTLATLAGTESLSNKTFSNASSFTEITTPSSPAASNDKLYFKSDGNLYKLNSSGVEVQIDVLSGTQTANTILAGPASGAASTPTFRAGVSSDILLATTAKITTYTATVSDDIITCSGSAFTVTLPAATTKKTFYIKKTDSSFANIITIARAGSDTIDGATSTTLNTQYEAITIVADGTSSWNVIQRTYPRSLNTYSMTVTGTTSNPTKGTTSTDLAQWRREGDSLFLTYQYVQTAAGAAGSGTYLYALPSGLTIDTAKQLVNTLVSRSNVGYGQVFSNDSTSREISVQAYDNSHLMLNAFSIADSTGSLVGSTLYALSGTDIKYIFTAIIPISGWN